MLLIVGLLFFSRALPLRSDPFLGLPVASVLFCCFLSLIVRGQLLSPLFSTL